MPIGSYGRARLALESVPKQPVNMMSDHNIETAQPTKGKVRGNQSGAPP